MIHTREHSFLRMFLENVFHRSRTFVLVQGHARRGTLASRRMIVDWLGCRRRNADRFVFLVRHGEGKIGDVASRSGRRRLAFWRLIGNPSRRRRPRMTFFPNVTKEQVGRVTHWSTRLLRPSRWRCTLLLLLEKARTFDCRAGMMFGKAHGKSSTNAGRARGGVTRGCRALENGTSRLHVVRGTARMTDRLKSRRHGEGRKLGMSRIGYRHKLGRRSSLGV